MGEKDPLSGAERRKLRKVNIGLSGDIVDSRDRVGLINNDTGVLLKQYYNLGFDSSTRAIIVKAGGESEPTGWDIAYDDAVSFFGRLDRCGFTDEFSAWLDQSYSDPSATPVARSHMMSAACVGMSVVLKALEVQLGDDFVERLERAVSYNKERIHGLLTENKLDVKKVLTPISHGKRGQIPRYQFDLRIMVDSVASQATYPSCVTDGAVITYRLVDSLWDEITMASAQTPSAQNMPGANGGSQTGRSLIVSLEDQARVDAQQKTE